MDQAPCGSEGKGGERSVNANVLAPIFLVLCAIALALMLILRVKRRWLMTALMTLLSVGALLLLIAAIGMWFAEYI